MKDKEIASFLDLWGESSTPSTSMSISRWVNLKKGMVQLKILRLQLALHCLVVPGFPLKGCSSYSGSRRLGAVTQGTAAGQVIHSLPPV